MKEGPSQGKEDLTSKEPLLHEQSHVLVGRMVVCELINKLLHKEIYPLKLSESDVYDALRALVQNEDVISLKHFISKLPFTYFEFTKSCFALELAAQKGQLDLFTTLWDFFDEKVVGPMPSSLIDYAAQGSNPRIVDLVMARQVRLNTYEIDRVLHQEAKINKVALQDGPVEDIKDTVLRPEQKPLMVSFSLSSTEESKESKEELEPKVEPSQVSKEQEINQQDLMIDRHQHYVQMMAEYSDSSEDSPYFVRKLK